jgi:hypothetical protein
MPGEKTMSNPPQRDPVPVFAREVLALFASAFRDVRFPDLDREVLESLAEELRVAQSEVERIEQALAQARAVVASKAEALTARAQRGLAYARIFAEEDAELCEQVERVAQSQGAANLPAAKRRGRPRKLDHDAGLFESMSEGESGRELQLDA